MNTSNPLSYIEMMKEFRSLTKEYIQLAIAALILPIIFMKDIFAFFHREDESVEINAFFFASWAVLFASIGFGMLYQYISTKYIVAGRGEYILFPRVFFSVCLIGFYVGVGLFVFGVIVVMSPKNA